MVYYDISKKESSKNDNLFVISDNFMIHMYKYYDTHVQVQ